MSEASKVEIDGTERVLDTTTLSGVTAYVVVVDAPMEKQRLLRRYNHFLALDASLRKAMAVPSDALPPLPPRTLLPASHHTIKQREQLLSEYLRGILASSLLAHFPCVMAFLSPQFRTGLVSLARPDHAGFLATSTGTLTLSGTRRFCVIAANVFVFFDSATTTADTPRGAMLLHDATVVRLSEARFELRRPRSGHSIRCETATKEDADLWCTKLSTAIVRSADTLLPVCACEAPIGGRLPI